MNKEQYKFSYMLPAVLEVAQREILNHDPKSFADLTWFEEQYGHELLERETMKKWFCVPSIRAGVETKWGKVLPELTSIAKSLPGVVNFSLNCIEPGGGVPTHSDYTYDMRKDLSGIDRVYVILIAVDIPDVSFEECGFHIGDDKVHMKTGDILAFDGSVPHGGWNKTDKWRYTINIDIKEEYWNV